ncbi:unnamed protein product, partial [Nesidiocoris tenuis]
MEVGDFVTVQVRALGAKINILPIYLNCNFWARDMSVLREFLEGQERVNYVLAGDFNARVSEEQNLEELSDESLGSFLAVRSSRDRVLNKQGKELLDMLADLGLVILNGRSAGDKEGHYTYISQRGSSVIDYVCAPLDLLELFDDFTVLAEAFSDHLPLSFTVRVEGHSSSLNQLPRLRWIPGNKDAYNRRLISSLPALQGAPADINLKTGAIVNAVRGAAVPMSRAVLERKNPWFDWECEGARTRSLSYLKLFRKSDSPTVRREYADANKVYKDLLARKRSEFFADLGVKFGGVRDSKGFWNLARSFKKGESSVQAAISPEEWVSHFRQLLNPAVSAGEMQYAEPFITSSILDGPFAMAELGAVLGSVKDHKAPGSDGIPFEFFKYADEAFLEHILDYFNGILDTGVVPEAFKEAVIFPLFKKKGDPGDAANYRGLSFVNCLSKLFTSLLANRLSLFVNEGGLLSECQNGFRKGYSTVDAIFTLCDVVRLRLSRPRGKLYAFFVDLRAAFDTVDRGLLFYKLLGMGVSHRMVRVLRSLYSGVTSSVWTRDGATESFPVGVGVRQGCPLSPLLFALYINDLTDVIVRGVLVGGHLVKLLMYADDLVILAEDSKDQQINIDALKRYCETWGLEVNLSKSKVMVFQNGGRRSASEKWMFGEEHIEVVSRYTYLGVVLTPRLSFEAQLKQKASSAKFAMNFVWGKLFSFLDIPLDCKWSVFQAVARSILCYAAQCWGFREYAVVEGVQLAFFRKIFSLPTFVPNYLVHLETQVDPLCHYTLELHLSYLAKVFSMPDHRLPKIVAQQVITERVYWAEEYGRLVERLGLDDRLECMDASQLRADTPVILGRLHEEKFASFGSRARTSDHFGLYRELNPGVKCAGVPGLDMHTKRWVVKLRTEGLWLNARPYSSVASENCSLCNMRLREDVFHFLCVCPVLAEFRIPVFGTGTLTREAAVELLDGRGWHELATFCTVAWKYRFMLIS